MHENFLTICARCTILWVNRTVPATVRVGQGERWGKCMLFSHLIEELQANQPIWLVCAEDVIDIQNVALLDGQQRRFLDNVVYFGYKTQLDSSMSPPAQCVLVCAGAAALPEVETGGLAMVEEAALFAVFNRAKELVDAARGKSVYTELTERADESRDLDAVLNAASIRLGNFLLFSDMNFKILAHSTSFPVTDPLWKQNIEQGYCSYDFIAAVRQLEPVRKAAFTTDAIEVTCPESPYRKLSSKVFLGSVQVGFVLMIESETAVTPQHLEHLRAVSRAVSYTISRYMPYLFQGGGQYQQFLYDLLIGASLEEAAQQLTGLTFSPRLAALSVRPTRYLGLRYLKENVGETLRQAFPGTHIAYHEGGVAALLPLEEAADLPPEQLARLEAFAGEAHVRIGVSNAFSRVENFAFHYARANSALELARRLGSGEAVCRYLDYQVYDLLAQAADPAQLGLYCHPALALLRQYDHRTDGALYQTLRTYLDCGCSIKQTAAALFIHRNSLVYRLERISQIGQLDLEQPDTRFLLRLSYRIDRYIGHDA